jgi:hypothetical protein
MAKKLSMEEKFQNAQNDLKTGKLKTVEKACKVHKLSPASFHIYRKKMDEGMTTKVSNEGPKVATMTTSPVSKKLSEKKLAAELSALRIVRDNLRADNAKLQGMLKEAQDRTFKAESEVRTLKDKIVRLV